MTTSSNCGSQRWRMGARLAAAVAGIAIAVWPGAAASAHTEASVVAVPALAPATVTFRPGHGCDGSPTVSVRVQAPVADAEPHEVDGWTATATPDGVGNTVVEWTGGVLPADEAGSFPVEIMVPDAVGALLAFPAIQRCENGAELAWIGTTPGDEHPAPQVLVLPAGSQPAATLDEVPLDAPGREQLVALAEGAAPEEPPASAPGVPTTAPQPSATSIAPATAVPATTAPVTAAPTTAASAPSTSDAPPTSERTSAPATTDDDDGGDGSTGAVLGGVAAVVVLGGGAAALLARRRAS